MLIGFGGGRGERGTERETDNNERENTDLLSLIHALIRDQTHNLGMCPD